MTENETELQMVRRHVRQGRNNVRRQRLILARLKATGGPVALAADLLATMETAQRKHEEHLSRILDGHAASRPAGDSDNK